MSRRAQFAVGTLLAVAVVVAAAAWLRPAGAVTSPGLMVSTQFAADGKVHLEIEARNLEPDASYTALLNAASGDAVGASAGTLGRIVADGTGLGRLTASTATIASGAVVPLSIDSFRGAGALISVVSASGDTVASTTVTAPPGD